MFAMLLSEISIVFVVAIVLQLGLNTDDLKLLTAVIVAVALSVPILIGNRRQISMYKKLTGKVKDDA